MAEVTETNKRWTEKETILALYLYFQLPFGKLHAGNPEIQQLAKALQRTNGSVAMKLSNFASLDPKITETGRRGLAGASALDRAIYAKFQSDWNGLVTEANELWHQLVDDERREQSIGKDKNLREERQEFIFAPYGGKGEKQTLVSQRLGQSFFRRAVLANFEERCCITGIAEPKLLVASHIRPWHYDQENRHNPANGFLLSATMDRSYDSGLITIDQEYRVHVSERLVQHPSVETHDFFVNYVNATVRPAIRFRPNPSFIDWHMHEVFVG